LPSSSANPDGTAGAAAAKATNALADELLLMTNHQAQNERESQTLLWNAQLSPLQASSPGWMLGLWLLTIHGRPLTV